MEALYFSVFGDLEVLQTSNTVVVRAVAGGAG